MKTPALMLTAPGKISSELSTRLKTEWEQNFGKGKRGSTAILGEGLKVELLDLSTAVDAELSRSNSSLASRRSRDVGRAAVDARAAR